MRQGDVLARSGILIDNGRALSVVGNKNVSMLHFETYDGSGGFSPNSKLNGSGLRSPFYRRADLMDSLAILQEGYRATFLDARPLPPLGNRIPIDQLKTSTQGKEFIKGWEGVHYDEDRSHTFYYDDSKNYCTVGWGHLVQMKSCSALGYTAMSSKISVSQAQTLFETDVRDIEERVRKAIHVPLYQQEFDALVSLAFRAANTSHR